MTTEATEPIIGQLLLERFRVLNSLGEGAMGVVFLGHDERENQRVAIKTLSEGALEQYSGQRSQLVARFRREIETTRRLQHPNIVRLLAAGELENHLPFVVLEYLEGWDLRDVLDDEIRVTPARAARLGIGVALALAESHEHGIVHRDLKPENIFLVQRPDAEEQVKVLDFGIARATDEEERLTVAGTAVGTPRYMSPEQVRDATLTSACDIYTFGVLLYEMLKGDVPFWDDNPIVLALKHVREDPPPLEVEDMAPEVLTAFRDLILSMMQRAPAQRPTATDVSARLARLHRLALAASGSEPDAATQILRFDPQTAAPSSQGVDRPTRVIGVRTALSWQANLQSQIAGKQTDKPPEKKAPSEFNRAATALLDADNVRQLVATDQLATKGEERSSASGNSGDGPSTRRLFKDGARTRTSLEIPESTRLWLAIAGVVVALIMLGSAVC